MIQGAGKPDWIVVDEAGAMARLGDRVRIVEIGFNGFIHEIKKHSVRCMLLPWIDGEVAQGPDIESWDGRFLITTDEDDEEEGC